MLSAQSCSLSLQGQYDLCILSWELPWYQPSPCYKAEKVIIDLQKIFLLKLQHMCAGQTQQKCVNLECGPSALTQGRLWNRFIILIKAIGSLSWQYIHYHVIHFLSYLISYHTYWYHRWWFPMIITIIFSYYTLHVYYTTIIISCLSYK